MQGKFTILYYVAWMKNLVHCPSSTYSYHWDHHLISGDLRAPWDCLLIDNLLLLQTIFTISLKSTSRQHIILLYCARWWLQAVIVWYLIVFCLLPAALMWCFKSTADGWIGVALFVIDRENDADVVAYCTWNCWGITVLVNFPLPIFGRGFVLLCLSLPIHAFSNFQITQASAINFGSPR